MKRERGNALFKAGNYRRALKLYQAVVSPCASFDCTSPLHAVTCAPLADTTPV